MPRQYQYQPITGPVWRAAVAASLAWLPQGQWQPVRQIPRPPPSYTVQPFTEAVEVARRLDWMGRAAQPQPLERRNRDLSVLPPFQQTAAPFDPALFPWGTTGGRYIPLETRRLGWSVAAVAEYDPTEMGWIPAGRDIGPRSLTSARLGDFRLDPFPLPGVQFDPKLFPWGVTGWQPQRGYAPPAPTTTVLPPFQPPFDPKVFPWGVVGGRWLTAPPVQRQGLVMPVPVPITVYPDVGSLVLDGFAPTVTGISVTPSGVGGRRPGIDVERERIWRRYWWRIAQTEKAEQKLNKRRAALHLPPLVPSEVVPELADPTGEPQSQARSIASLLFEARAEIKRLEAYIAELEDLNTAYLALLADNDIEVDDG